MLLCQKSKKAMRLKSVSLSQYKNLVDFSLSFDSDNFIDVFVGKNGTGKSNLLEALIEIFHHLYEYGKKIPDSELSFDYSITYEIDNKEHKIEWKSGQLKINNRDRKTIGNTPLPDNILIYYSGHNDTVRNLIEKYEEVFRTRIKRADIRESRRFIGVGSAYKELLLNLSSG
jgi:predicted ATP-dependent endonuclease of OLD family